LNKKYDEVSRYGHLTKDSKLGDKRNKQIDLILHLV